MSYLIVSAGYTQTKQFFILYNGLDDKKVYMTKEINLLNSINEQFVKLVFYYKKNLKKFKFLQIVELCRHKIQKINF